MEIFILLWIVCGLAAAMIASQRGASGCLWFGLGVLLGPIGLVCSFAAGDHLVKCPHCQKHISPKATRCPECQSSVGAHSAASIADARENDQTQKLIDALKGQGQVSAASKKCPDCAEDIRAEARKCRFCGYQF